MITIVIYEILFLTWVCESYQYHCHHSVIAFETCLVFFFLFYFMKIKPYIFLLPF